MKTSTEGVQLIKFWEGLELEAYQDIAGVWTIGYGHTETAKPGMKITAFEAERLLKNDLAPRERAIVEMVTAPINQPIFDALVSFVYNVGVEAFRGSTARKRLNRGDYEGAAEALTWWNKATVGGVLRRVDGLVNRRNAEKALFLRGVMELRRDEELQQREEGVVLQPGACAFEKSVTTPDQVRKRGIVGLFRNKPKEKA